MLQRPQYHTGGVPRPINSAWDAAGLLQCRISGETPFHHLLTVDVPSVLNDGTPATGPECTRFLWG